MRRGETGVPGENLSMQSREPTNSTHIWRRIWESNPGHIGWRRVLSPLRHPCTPAGCSTVNKCIYHHMQISCMRGELNQGRRRLRKRFCNHFAIIPSFAVLVFFRLHRCWSSLKSKPRPFLLWPITTRSKSVFNQSEFQTSTLSFRGKMHVCMSWLFGIKCGARFLSHDKP